MDKNEVSWLEDETGEESPVFHDSVWSIYKHEILMNQISFNDQIQITYPDRKKFRDRMVKAAVNIEFNTNSQLIEYDSMTEGMVRGVNYSKLNNPVHVFNHHAPRSLLSILHLLVENSGPLEK